MNPRKQPDRVLIIVEGNDDERFLDCLIRRESLTGYEVQPIGGVENVKNELPLLLKRAGALETTRVVAAVVDADNDPTNRQRSYEGHLRRHAPGLRHAVYLLPDNEKPGMLEDLCCSAMKDNVRRNCAEEFVNCLDANNHKGANRSKTMVQAYIAAHKSSYRHLGEAADKGEFDFNHPDIRKLVEFIRKVGADTAT